MKASVLYPSQCILGEGPIWHAESKCCFWVDIEKGVLYEYNWLPLLKQLKNAMNSNRKYFVNIHCYLKKRFYISIIKLNQSRIA